MPVDLVSQSPTYCDSHHIGAPWGILWNSGNVVVRGELGNERWRDEYKVEARINSGLWVG